MHIYISGIGGSGMSALANLALDSGFLISGSDLNPSFNTKQLESRGVKITFDQSGQGLLGIHQQEEIYWFVHSSSIKKNHLEWKQAHKQGLNISKREDLINFILRKKNLKLISIAGTHGKTTTTAMFVWLVQNLKIPISYLVGSNLGWGLSGKYQEKSQYLLMETDEYDKNFLHYNPYSSIITSLDYDHPDIYATSEEYLDAFLDFAQRSLYLVGFEEDLQKLKLNLHSNFGQKITTLRRKFGQKTLDFKNFKLLGLHNRQNAGLVASMFDILWQEEISKNFDFAVKNQQVWDILSNFPGTKRRMEKLLTNFYTDYAHHPVEIKATMQLASELGKKIIAVYQPHQNLRQHQVIQDYRDCFNLADKVYWLPTYLVREKEDLEVLSPQKLTVNLENKNVEIADLNNYLNQKILEHLKKDELVLLMGAGNIDDWFRRLLNDKLI